MSDLHHIHTLTSSSSDTAHEPSMAHLNNPQSETKAVPLQDGHVASIDQGSIPPGPGGPGGPPKLDKYSYTCKLITDTEKTR